MIADLLIVVSKMVLSNEDALTSAFLIAREDENAEDIILSCVTEVTENFPILIKPKCWLVHVSLIEAVKFKNLFYSALLFIGSFTYN